jgi:LmbE family N-acetylglucosaminyl deacetylase
MQAIQTRYSGPNNRRGAVVTAYTDGTGHVLSLPWDHALTEHQNHTACAKAALAELVKTCHWPNRVMVGAFWRGDVYWVYSTEEELRF